LSAETRPAGHPGGLLHLQSRRHIYASRALRPTFRKLPEFMLRFVGFSDGI
jgi:hypothetical protein